MTPNAVVQRMRFGETGVSVCVDDFGEDGPECFTEGTMKPGYEGFSLQFYIPFSENDLDFA